MEPNNDGEDRQCLQQRIPHESEIDGNGRMSQACPRVPSRPLRHNAYNLPIESNGEKRSRAHRRRRTWRWRAKRALSRDGHSGRHPATERSKRGAPHFHSHIEHIVRLLQRGTSQQQSTPRTGERRRGKVFILNKIIYPKKWLIFGLQSGPVRCTHHLALAQWEETIRVMVVY